MSGFPITIFADFTCPYSYVTEAALRRRAVADGIAVRPRAFELYPAPTPPVAPADEPDWRDRAGPLAAELGLELGAPAFRPRTRKAHEAACFAAERGVGAAMREAVYAAYWGRGRDIGRIDVLTELVSTLDVDPEELRIALDIDRFREEVLRDQALARQLRVPGVPTLFIGTGPTARILVGAQSPAALDAALRGG